MSDKDVYNFRCLCGANQWMLKYDGLMCCECLREYDWNFGMFPEQFSKALDRNLIDSGGHDEKS